jgi:hypothetical protein
VVIRVEGGNLPGRRCNPGPEGPHENVHVGIGSRGLATELVRGDASAASWRFQVRPVAVAGGSWDFSGPLVEGRRGDRFLYLNWGDVAADGSFRLFRRAKIDLSALDAELVRKAVDEGAELRCEVDLTDAKGNPSCARFRPPAIAWSIARAEEG